MRGNLPAGVKGDQCGKKKGGKFAGPLRSLQGEAPEPTSCVAVRCSVRAFGQSQDHFLVIATLGS